MVYRDYRWEVTKNKKGIEVFCHCQCGIRHDIMIDNKNKFVGSGTTFGLDPPPILSPKKKKKRR